MKSRTLTNLNVTNFTLRYLENENFGNEFTLPIYLKRKYWKRIYVTTQKRILIKQL